MGPIGPPSGADRPSPRGTRIWETHIVLRAVEPSDLRRVSYLAEVSDSFAGLRAVKMGEMRSPITGTDGNVEFLAWFRVEADDRGVQG